MSHNLETALDQCLAWLRQGMDIEHCLDRYPEHAAELRPLLETAMDVALAPFPKAPAGARAAGEQQMLAALAQRHERIARINPIARFVRQLSWSLLSGRTGNLRPAWQLVGVLLVIVLLAAGWMTVAASADSLPGDLLYPVKMASQRAQLALTLDPAQHGLLADQFETQRRLEVRTVLEGRRTVSVEFRGILQQMDGDLWIVGGLPVVISETKVIGQPYPGAMVHVRADLPGNGELVASWLGIESTATPPPTDSPKPTTTPSPTQTPTPVETRQRPSPTIEPIATTRPSLTPVPLQPTQPAATDEPTATMEHGGAPDAGETPEPDEAPELERPLNPIGTIRPDEPVGDDRSPDASETPEPDETPERETPPDVVETAEPDDTPERERPPDPTGTSEPDEPTGDDHTQDAAATPEPDEPHEDDHAPDSDTPEPEEPHEDDHIHDSSETPEPDKPHKDERALSATATSEPDEPHEDDQAPDPETPEPDEPHEDNSPTAPTLTPTSDD